MPLNAKANVLSSIFGNSVSADVLDSLTSAQDSKNSQNMPLLQANVSAALVSGDQDIEDNTDTSIASDSALIPTTNHLTIPGEIEAGDSYSDQISVYVIRKGDSISQIAQMFGVSANTILWANDMKKSDKLVEGDVLVILPISGLEHVITKGQTLASIAKLYKADISDIARFNGITEDGKLTIGDKIIVPGGEIYNESSSPKTNNNIYKTPTVNVAGYFINPVPAFSRRSQGLHGPGNRGIDLAAPTGTPVLASASGTVLIARNGWNGAYGNLVIIVHPNGTRTLYAHLSKINTRTGAQVRQGQVIGYVGSTGRSTGPHLHFEIFNAKNPGGTTPMSWAK